MKANGKLKFVLAYFDESVTEQETTDMEVKFREILLKPSDN